MDYRSNNNVKRNDFIQMMMQLMSKGYLEDVDAVRTGSMEEAIEGQC